MLFRVTSATSPPCDACPLREECRVHFLACQQYVLYVRRLSPQCPPGAFAQNRAQAKAVHGDADESSLPRIVSGHADTARVAAGVARSCAPRHGQAPIRC